MNQLGKSEKGSLSKKRKRDNHTTQTKHYIALYTIAFLLSYSTDSQGLILLILRSSAISTPSATASRQQQTSRAANCSCFLMSPPCSYPMPARLNRFLLLSHIATSHDHFCSLLPLTVYSILQCLSGRPHFLSEYSYHCTHAQVAARPR